MIHTRQITLHDIDIVFNYVKQLATQEGVISPEFSLTKEKLLNNLFSNNADWFGLLILKDNKIVGTCLYCFANINRVFNPTPCLFLDILFIEPEYRKQGIGEFVLEELKQIMKQQDIKRIELWCLKDNFNANKFYEKQV
jgi:GNAT superfamily N-acetyltransferase